MRDVCLLLLLLACSLLNGCTTHRSVAPTTQPVADTQLASPSINENVRATVVPPVGWRMDPLKHTSKHDHQTWLSPSGHTAYGVIHFSLPLPVGHDLALWGYLREMKRDQGEAVLISKQWDENLPGLRFVADGGLYRVRTNLFVRGWEGWAVYAGTLRDQPIEEQELDLAERAREHTFVGTGGGEPNRASGDRASH